MQRSANKHTSIPKWMRFLTCPSAVHIRWDVTLFTTKWAIQPDPPNNKALARLIPGVVIPGPCRMPQYPMNSPFWQGSCFTFPRLCLQSHHSCHWPILSLLVLILHITHPPGYHGIPSAHLLDPCTHRWEIASTLSRLSTDQFSEVIGWCELPAVIVLTVRPNSIPGILFIPQQRVYSVPCALYWQVSKASKRRNNADLG